jgi:hypothetical protein
MSECFGGKIKYRNKRNDFGTGIKYKNLVNAFGTGGKYSIGTQ